MIHIIVLLRNSFKTKSHVLVAGNTIYFKSIYIFLYAIYAIRTNDIRSIDDSHDFFLILKTVLDIFFGIGKLHFLFKSYTPFYISNWKPTS